MVRRSPKVRERNIRLVSKTAKKLIDEYGYATSRMVYERLQNRKIKYVQFGFTHLQISQYIRMSKEFENKNSILTIKK